MGSDDTYTTHCIQRDMFILNHLHIYLFCGSNFVLVKFLMFNSKSECIILPGQNR